MGGLGFGEVDAGFSSAVTSPRSIQGIADVQSVEVGYETTCALLSDGTAKCWGDGAAGMMGNGTTGVSPTPVTSPTPVLRISDIAQMTVGDLHVCARRKTGDVACWGSDYEGQQGDGNIGCDGGSCVIPGRERDYPTTLPGITGATDIAARGRHTCVALQDGTVECWGTESAPDGGDALLTPYTVIGVSGAIRVAVGDRFGCALTPTDLLCWGDNDVGQLGRGTTGGYALRADRVAIDGSKVHAISAADTNACVVLDATAYCWGDNTYGQTGQAPSSTPVATPSLVHVQDPVVQVAVGSRHACAVTATGDIWCWGDNNFGELGNGTIGGSSPTPVKVVW